MLHPHATHTAKNTARQTKQNDKLRAAQARLADKSFSDFMRAHNARRAELEG